MEFTTRPFQSLAIDGDLRIFRASGTSENDETRAISGRISSLDFCAFSQASERSDIVLEFVEAVRFTILPELIR